jgi:hypothetical protein
MTKVHRRLKRRSIGSTALGAVVGLCTPTFGCVAPWYVRPKQASRVVSLYGRNDDFRVCVRQAARPIRSLQLESRGRSLDGVIGDQDDAEACGFFDGPAAARALDGESTLIADAEHSSAPERIPLTSTSIEFVPHSRIELTGRVAYTQPLAAGYAGLVQLHNTLSYRLARWRFGAVYDARINGGTALLGAGPVVNGSLRLSERWLLGLDASYGLGIAPYGAGKWDGQWYHGPGATLSLGHTPAPFLGAPESVERPALGAAISVEYLRVPRQDQGLVVLGIGLMFRNGL